MDTKEERDWKNAFIIAALCITCLILGMVIGHIIEKREARTSCYAGCYNAIEIILRPGETVEGDFPESYDECRRICGTQHGI